MALALFRASAGRRGAGNAIMGYPQNYIPKVDKKPAAGTTPEAPPRPPTWGEHVTRKVTDEQWLKATPGTGINFLQPWKQKYRQVHGDYTQCTAGTFGELKACMPKPRRFFSVPPPRLIDQFRVMLVQDALKGGKLSAAEGISAGRQADLLVKDLEIGGMGGYTDEYLRTLLAWHKNPEGKTIPIPTDKDDVHTFVMDGLRDEMTVEDVALHRIRQAEETDYIRKLNVGGIFVFLGFASIILLPLWCIPMWRPFMSKMWVITDDEDWCIRRYGRGKLYSF